MLSYTLALVILTVGGFAARVREGLEDAADSVPWKFTSSLAAVRASAKAEIQALENESAELSPRVVEDFCSSCEMILQESWKGKAAKCEMPLCQIVKIASAEPVVKSHLRLMSSLKIGRAMFRETCKDLGMCGIEGNLLLETEVPAAKELREEAAKRLRAADAPVNFKQVCRECRAHVGHFLSVDECSMGAVSFGRGVVMPLCKPEGYCLTSGTTFSSAQCWLPSEVAQQRKMPVDELRKVPVLERKVSPLLREAAGSSEIPWLHSWAKSTSEQQACELVGMCGNDESAFSRQSKLRERTVQKIAKLKSYFTDQFEKEWFFKEMRASWTTVSKLSQVSNELFQMRHVLDEQLRAELLLGTQDMMHAMSKSGFFDSVPGFLSPVISHAMESMTAGAPMGPRAFLQALARGFAVQTTFGDVQSAHDSLKKLASEIGDLSADDVEEEDVHAEGSGSLMQVAEAEPFVIGSVTISSTQAAIGYGTIYTLCATLAVYSQNVDYVVYCGAWPAVVGYLYHEFISTLDSLKKALTDLDGLQARMNQLLKSPDFQAVMSEAIVSWVGQTMQGQPLEGGIKASTLVITKAIDEIDFGDLDKIVKDDRVKQAVRDALREGITKLKLHKENFRKLIPEVFKSEGHRIGEAAFQVAMEDSPELSKSVKMLEDALDKAKDEKGNTTEIVIRLLSAPGSPLLGVMVQGCSMLMELILPGRAKKDVPLLALLEKEDVQNAIQEALQKVEEPYTAAKIAGRLLSSDDLRQAVIKRAFEVIAPGMNSEEPHEQVTQTVQQSLVACAAGDS